MKSHVTVILAVLLSAIACGATFLLALHRQLALVEVAASLAVMVILYLLSSSIGDLIEKKAQASKPRLFAALGLALVVAGFFLMSKHLHA